LQGFYARLRQKPFLALEVNGLSRENRKTGKNKMIGVWVSLEEFERFQKFLDQFSSGESFSEQVKSFVHWLGTQTEGITLETLALETLRSLGSRENLIFHRINATCVEPDWSFSFESEVCPQVF
jgi:hypothetical protein